MISSHLWILHKNQVHLGTVKYPKESSRDPLNDWKNCKTIPEKDLNPLKKKHAQVSRSNTALKIHGNYAFFNVFYADLIKLSWKRNSPCPWLSFLYFLWKKLRPSLVFNDSNMKNTISCFILIEETWTLISNSQISSGFFTKVAELHPYLIIVIRSSLTFPIMTLHTFFWNTPCH